MFSSSLLHKDLSSVYIVFALLGAQALCQTHYDNEKSLRTALLTNYQYKIRPQATVTCSIRLSLLTINILNVPEQSLSVSGWLVIKWNDSRLTWNPSTYGNIEDIYDTELVLWRPEIIVDNSIANLGILENDKLLIRATSLGEMTWEPLGIFVTHCDVDVTYYPFDTQTCSIEVTSWGYTKNEVDLTAFDRAVYLEEFSQNGEWDVLETWNEKRELVDGGDVHAQIDFHLRLRRRPTYYVMTILIPAFVTSVLCVLIFLLPSDSGEKVGYALTILLTYTVMLTLVAGYMPSTSKTTSILSVYLTIILFIGAFATLITVIGLYFHYHTNQRPPPPSLQYLTTKCLLPFVRWKRSDSTHPSDDDELKGNNGKAFTSPNRVRPFTSNDKNKTKTSLSTNEKTESVNEFEENEKEVAQELTWKDISVIMDSFFFRLMGTGVLCLTFFVMLALLIGAYS